MPCDSRDTIKGLSLLKMPVWAFVIYHSAFVSAAPDNHRYKVRGGEEQIHQWSDLCFGQSNYTGKRKPTARQIKTMNQKEEERTVGLRRQKPREPEPRGTLESAASHVQSKLA